MWKCNVYNMEMHTHSHENGGINNCIVIIMVSKFERCINFKEKLSLPLLFLSIGPGRVADILRHIYRVPTGKIASVLNCQTV